MPPSYGSHSKCKHSSPSSENLKKRKKSTNLTCCYSITFPELSHYTLTMSSCNIIVNNFFFTYLMRLDLFSVKNSSLLIAFKENYRTYTYKDMPTSSSLTRDEKKVCTGYVAQGVCLISRWRNRWQCLRYRCYQAL